MLERQDLTGLVHPQGWHSSMTSRLCRYLSDTYRLAKGTACVALALKASMWPQSMHDAHRSPQETTAVACTARAETCSTPSAQHRGTTVTFRTRC